MCFHYGFFSFCARGFAVELRRVLDKSCYLGCITWLDTPATSALALQSSVAVTALRTEKRSRKARGKERVTEGNRGDGDQTQRPKVLRRSLNSKPTRPARSLLEAHHSHASTIYTTPPPGKHRVKQHKNLQHRRLRKQILHLAPPARLPRPQVADAQLHQRHPAQHQRKEGARRRDRVARYI